MYWLHRDAVGRLRQEGQVLAEAVVVMLMLVLLVGAVHVSGRLQFQWAKQWLDAQISADAVALEHATLPADVSVGTGQRSHWRNWVMRDFAIGEPHWQSVSTDGRFGQTAWRLSGAGQTSLDASVSARIKNAPRLWRRTELASKAVVYALMPTIKAVEAPWEDRGPATQWLDLWQGSTPPQYLRSVR